MTLFINNNKAVTCMHHLAIYHIELLAIPSKVGFTDVPCRCFYIEGSSRMHLDQQVYLPLLVVNAIPYKQQNLFLNNLLNVIDAFELQSIDIRSYSISNQMMSIHSICKKQ